MVGSSFSMMRLVVPTPHQLYQTYSSCVVGLGFFNAALRKPARLNTPSRCALRLFFFSHL
jgi:hypothetical protein